jgi:hypothetical protein
MPPGASLKSEFGFLGAPIAQKRRPALRALYLSLRASAEKWQANRTAFMEARLKKGSHPDTDPNFWSGYAEIPRPPLHTWHDWFDDLFPQAVILAIPLIPLVILFLLFLVWKHRKKAAARLAG